MGLIRAQHSLTGPMLWYQEEVHGPQAAPCPRRLPLDTSTGERATMVLRERVKMYTSHPLSPIIHQRSHLFPEGLKESLAWCSKKVPNSTPLLG